MKKDEIATPEQKEIAVLSEQLSSAEKLMKAAQKFAIAFQNRTWPDETARLSYTLDTWRTLAFAALEFSEKNKQLSQQP